MVKDVTDESFKVDVSDSKIPVIVDFWAEWCGPCKMLGPIVEDIAKELEGKVKVLKMNIDENPNTPSSKGIKSIPTLMLFKDGELVASKVGALAKAPLLDWIKQYI